MVQSGVSLTDGPRVALFIDSLECGGAEKITVIQANALVARGYKVDLLLRWHRGAFLTDLDPTINVFAPAAGNGSAWHSLRFLMKYFRQTPPVAMFSHMEKPSLLALWAGHLTGFTKIIPCIHTDLTTYARLEHSLRRTILKYLVALFYRWAPRIVCVSNGTALSTAALIGTHAPPIDVVRNGFDLEAKRQHMSDDTGIPWLQVKTTPVIIACGRLVEQKGYDVLLHAFAHLRASHPARLLILGEGPLRGTLQTLAERLQVAEVTKFISYHPHPEACFAKSDVFALASRVEGLSNVLIEALIVGIPIVSTDCPTGPREVLANGAFGRLVPVNDSAALATALGEALDQGKASIPTQGPLATHLEEYSAAHMITRYLDTLQHVIK